MPISCGRRTHTELGAGKRIAVARPTGRKHRVRQAAGLARMRTRVRDLPVICKSFGDPVVQAQLVSIGRRRGEPEYQSSLERGASRQLHCHSGNLSLHFALLHFVRQSVSVVPIAGKYARLRLRACGACPIWGVSCLIWGTNLAWLLALNALLSRRH